MVGLGRGLGRVQRCDLGYRAADLGWSTADLGYSADFDESQGSRGTNAKDFTVCKSPTITLQLDRAQLKLELSMLVSYRMLAQSCPASVTGEVS